MAAQSQAVRRPQQNNLHPLPPDLLAWLQSKAEIAGVTRTARVLNVSRELLVSALAGKWLREGSVLVLRERALSWDFVPTEAA